jgi:phosphoribosylanthranilate isomerase
MCPGALRTRIKICGVTREADAAHLAAAGADLIGLNLWPRSPRHVEPGRAADLAAAARAANPGIVVVAIFVDPTPAEVEIALDRIGIDVAQFHGDEPPALVDRFAVRAIKAFAPTTAAEIGPAAGRFTVRRFLLDTPSAARGGTGQLGDWALAAEARERLAATGRHLFLAGGLAPDNVAQAIARVRPFGVDVASGVERAPGIKDPARVDAFIAAVRRADDNRASERGSE